MVKRFNLEPGPMTTRTLLAALLLLPAMPGEMGASAATFTVTTTDDSGVGSLRQALLDANSHPGAQLIQFSLPGNGVQTIAPLTPLPDITNSVTIDGYSQPGAQANSLTNDNDGILLVRLDGVNLTNGFPIGLRLNGANNNVVRGLIIVRFYTGIQLYASSGNRIAGNWLGLDFDNIKRGGAGTGVDVTCAVFNRSTANVIGGLTPGDRNVIAGFHTGISFFPTTADHNIVQGNFIGVDATGSLPRGNLFEGVKVQGATNITVGGASPGARNLIGANGTGILLLGSAGDAIQGNYIGTDVTGNYDLGNTEDGIDIQGCSFVTVGGSGAGNLVCNNSGFGVFVLGGSTNILQGNRVGTDLTGTFPLGNGKDGVNLQGTSAVTIGGMAAGAANVIEFNNGAGINVVSGNTNTISANSIFDNGDLGILLGPGANQSQAAPVLTGATTAYGLTQVQGALQSQPSSTVRIEFFASPTWDPLGAGEGQAYLGAMTTTTDPAGNAAFTTVLPVSILAGKVVTATTTDAVGNTSQFSTASPVALGAATVALAATVNGNIQTLYWPALATAYGFQLERALSMTPASRWEAITSGITNDGITCSFVAPNDPSSPTQFFRLHWSSVRPPPPG